MSVWSQSSCKYISASGSEHMPSVGQPICCFHQGIIGRHKNMLCKYRKGVISHHICVWKLSYLYDRSFIMESDHESLDKLILKRLITKPQKLQNIMLRLQQYCLWLGTALGKNEFGCSFEASFQEHHRQDKLDLWIYPIAFSSRSFHQDSEGDGQLPDTLHQVPSYTTWIARKYETCSEALLRHEIVLMRLCCSMENASQVPVCHMTSSCSNFIKTISR